MAIYRFLNDLEYFRNVEIGTLLVFKAASTLERSYYASILGQ